jgi:prepilin-type N-terminal cleavage/methylation domain-containing protein
MSERPAAPEATRGFTLLELLLAMTALALVTAICYGAFHLGIRAVERGEVAVVTAQRLRVASDTLIRQIKSTVPYPARNRDEEVYPYFTGTATSMAFITASGLSGGGGLSRVVYQVVENPTRLVVSESAFFSPDGLGREPVDKPGERSAVLLDGFRTLRFDYLMNDGVDTEWWTQWDAHTEETLPSAVRIVVEGLPGLDDVWGQEIPLMSTTYGENLGEVDEEDLGDFVDTEDEAPDADREDAAARNAGDADAAEAGDEDD